MIVKGGAVNSCRNRLSGDLQSTKVGFRCTKLQIERTKHES